MNVGSLFSGIGGIEIGFEREGFKTEWFIENNLYCQTILKKQFPGTIIYGDITKINFADLPRVDILTGGFPCQDISQAGKGIGITGSRSSLWKYYCEAIRTIRPKYAVIENVSMLARRGLNVVLSDLAKIGYDAEWYNISASSIGANHRRERLIIIAYPNSQRHIYREFEEQSTEERKQTQCEFKSSCEITSNANLQRLERQHNKEYNGWKSKETSGWRGYWKTESKLDRVADGIPYWVDRVKCLGNAVVPGVAQVFARAIKEKEDKSFA